jgi:hypothetical protein
MELAKVLLFPVPVVVGLTGGIFVGLARWRMQPAA